jgi:hypothetical protein
VKERQPFSASDYDVIATALELTASRTLDPKDEHRLVVLRRRAEEFRDDLRAKQARLFRSAARKEKDILAIKGSIRGRIIQYIRKHPGQTTAFLAKALQIEDRKISMQLHRLEIGGIVDSKKGEGPRGGKTWCMAEPYRKSRYAILTDANT